MTRNLFLIAFLLLGPSWLQGQTKDGPFVGVITETMCRGDHKSMGNTPPAKCTVDCVRSNPERYRYALLSGKDLYVLSDQQGPEKFAAQKVKVTGVLHEKTAVIDVKKIEPVR